MNASQTRPTFASRSLARLIGSASVAGLLVGCAAQTRLTPPAGLIADADWPARITAGLEQLAANTPTILVADQDNASGSDTPAREGESPRPSVRAVHCEAYALGIVLELEHLKPDEATRPANRTDLAFVSFSPLVCASSGVEKARAHLPNRITLADIDAGVRWHLYEPTHTPPRGLVVHLGGNKYVRRALLKRGWALLSSSSTGRFFQRRESPQLFRIERGQEKEVAARLATIIDDELVDWPYSLEALLEYLADHRPHIPQEPLVVMGFSIGALGLPAVVARMPDRFQAAVLVAGGANLLEIARRSSKPDPGIELNWTGPAPTHEDWQQLSAAYLAQVKLDPYHTAAALTDMPVLLCHAHYDQVVPAAMGELLYARLGKPRRLTFPVGHFHLLRIVMRLQADRIAKWAQAAISHQPATPGPLPAN